MPLRPDGGQEMSVTSVDTKAAPGAADSDDNDKSSAGRLWVVGAIMAVAAILSGFYAIDEYSAGTTAIVRTANDDAGDFQSVFRDLVQARFRVLGLAADVMLQDRTAIEAFAKNDRAALVARMEPFFEQLQKNHNLEQLNLWTPPAKLYYRAGKPNEIGVDVSKYRRTVVAANERQDRILAVEVGIAGHTDVRAIVPVVFDGKFIGVLELASNFDLSLERASAVSGLKWALGITKEVSERVERPNDPKIDSWQKDDVFFRYADPDTAQIMHAISFDPRSKNYTVTNVRDRTVFVKTFPVIDFSGAPSITIATLRDLTEAFGSVLRSALIRGLVVFLVISVIGSLAYLRFGQIRERLTGVVGRQRKELAAQVAFCDAAVAKLKEVDLLKRGFFTNLVTAVNEPLQAVVGQLTALVPAAEKAGDRGISERLRFALAETSRLSHLVEDYQQIELFRQKLVKNEAPLVSLAPLIAKVVEEDLAVYLRLPELTITTAVPADLPPARADEDLLRRAIGNLVGFAARGSGRGSIAVTGRQDAQKWLVLTIAGSAFAGAAAPTDSLLDESRQFLAQLTSVDSPGAPGASMVGVVLARIIVEFYGGSLSISGGEQPGFVTRLPAAT
jgi:signal transduction histidine kinase